jgi:hypothetical protein
VDGLAREASALNEGDANARVIQQDANQFTAGVACASDNANINVGVNTDINVGVDPNMNGGVAVVVYDFHSCPGFMR